MWSFVFILFFSRASSDSSNRNERCSQSFPETLTAVTGKSHAQMKRSVRERSTTGFISVSQNIIVFKVLFVQVKRGSLLSQPQAVLQKLASISDGNPLAPRNTRGFLFQTLSPEKDGAASAAPQVSVQAGFRDMSVVWDGGGKKATFQKLKDCSFKYSFTWSGAEYSETVSVTTLLSKNLLVYICDTRGSQSPLHRRSSDYVQHTEHTVTLYCNNPIHHGNL